MQNIPYLDSTFFVFIISIIDGMETLDALEKINEKNRPLEHVRIQSITIHANPHALIGTK